METPNPLQEPVEPDGDDGSEGITPPAPTAATRQTFKFGGTLNAHTAKQAPNLSSSHSLMMHNRMRKLNPAKAKGLKKLMGSRGRSKRLT